jgi:CheY-like chemotaxis protein
MQVKDTGPGIPPENLERIFDPFFTTKDVGEGTGLGLAVVHGIVQDRSGGITVQSEEGRGTAFTVYLPASAVESVEEDAGERMEPHLGTERILFVDDEPMIMKLGQRMLERRGYTVETRACGTDALECFRQNPFGFDLVITDMTMPGMRGDRLAEEVLAIRPDIPVILSTGYSKQISKDKAQEIGIRAFVMKPLTQHELANTVRRVLDGKPQK